jgi:hypothetical protein
MHLGDIGAPSAGNAGINGVTLKAVIKPTGTLRYAFQAGAQCHLDRDQELGVRDPDHRRRQRRNLGHGHDISLD